MKKNKVISKLEQALRDFESDRAVHFDVTNDGSWRIAHAFEALLEAVGYIDYTSRYIIEGDYLLPAGDTGKSWLKYTKLKEE